MTKIELESYDAMTADRDRWREQSEFWKNRSINFEATLRTIRFIAVDSDIKQLAGEALNKSHDQ